MVPRDRYYTENHEWLIVDGPFIRIGITQYAQHELGEIVFVDLPDVGVRVDRGKSFAVIESVKSVSDLYAPVTGRVDRVNTSLEHHPELLNEDPYDKGWIAVFRLKHSPDETLFLDATGYDRFIQSPKRPN